MTIPREEIVREFIESIDGLPRLFTVTEAADVTERLIERSTAAQLSVIAKLAELLPGPRGREVMFTPMDTEVVRYAVAYAEAVNHSGKWERRG